jgi:hypothetical protein
MIHPTRRRRWSPSRLDTNTDDSGQQPNHGMGPSLMLLLQSFLTSFLDLPDLADTAQRFAVSAIHRGCARMRVWARMLVRSELWRSLISSHPRIAAINTGVLRTATARFRL